MAIHHLKTTVKNQLGSVGLQAKIDNYRKEKQPAGDAIGEHDANQIDSTVKSKKSSPTKVKQLVKRAKQANGDQSNGKPSPGGAGVTAGKKEPGSTPNEQPRERRFDPTIFTVAQWAVVENELECQALWNDIFKRKRELKALYKKWYACHERSVYHSDPVPEFHSAAHE